MHPSIHVFSLTAYCCLQQTHSLLLNFLHTTTAPRAKSSSSACWTTRSGEGRSSWRCRRGSTSSKPGIIQKSRRFLVWVVVRTGKKTDTTSLSSFLSVWSDGNYPAYPRFNTSSQKASVQALPPPVYIFSERTIVCKDRIRLLPAGMPTVTHRSRL